MASIRDFFLSDYRNSSFLLQQKARTLFYFSCILIVVTPLLSILLQIFTANTFLSMLNLILMTIILSALGGLVLLRREIGRAHV